MKLGKITKSLNSISIVSEDRNCVQLHFIKVIKMKW